MDSGGLLGLSAVFVRDKRKRRVLEEEKKTAEQKRKTTREEGGEEEEECPSREAKRPRMNNSKIEKENEQSEFSNHEEEVSPPHLVPRTPGDILTKIMMLKVPGAELL